MSERIDVGVIRARVPEPPSPSADSVSTWESTLARFSSVLSKDERERARAYRIPQSRDVFILARGLLRVELSKRLGMDATEIHFDVRPSGKPAVRPGEARLSDWRFSVSHTGPHVAIAFALGVDVGVDIERLDRKVTFLDIAKRYFTPDELASLEAIPAENRSRGFFAGWTRKEAVVKARGHTMAESLGTLTVELDLDARHPRYEDAPGLKGRPVCRLTAFEFEHEKLIGAVAVQSTTTPRLEFKLLSEASFD